MVLGISKLQAHVSLNYKHERVPASVSVVSEMIQANYYLISCCNEGNQFLAELLPFSPLLKMEELQLCVCVISFLKCVSLTGATYWRRHSLSPSWL